MVLLALGSGEEELPAEQAAELEFTNGGSITVPSVERRRHLLGGLLLSGGTGDHRLAPSGRPFTEGSGAQSGRDMAPVPNSDAPVVRPFTLLLVAALTAGVVQQGAYYRSGQALVALLIAFSVLLALRHQPWTRKDFWQPALWPVVALGVWAVVRATVAGDPSLAAGIVALLLGLVAVIAVCRRTRDRQMLAASIVALGVLVALTGWIGVLWRITSLAQEDQGLWRATTTLTYSNAAAGFLAPVALVALGRAAARPLDPIASMVSCVLLVGTAATLSRAGVLALALGLATLVVLLRPARAGPVLVGPVAGAAIAIVGLVPSVPADTHPRPMLGAAALLLGLAVAAGLAVATYRAGIVVLAFVLGVSAMAVAYDGGDALDALRAKRLVLSSSDRARELDAALDVARAHPFAGVGPGRAVLEWTGPDGPLRARYVHNEYVQVLVELGGVGLALLLAAFVAVARLVARSAVAAQARAPWAGAAAALVALTVGSAFDFLWHVPAVPLAAALIIGLTTPHAESPDPTGPVGRRDKAKKERACN